MPYFPPVLSYEKDGINILESGSGVNNDKKSYLIPVCQKILLLIFDSNSLPFSSVEK
jgi:hypothetical protein